ncbi:hypothetical protein Tco_0585458 [Tanacetum coccineum]
MSQERVTVHERRKPRPCGSLLDILTGQTNTTCDEPPRAVSSRLGRRSPIGTQATHACCFIPKPRTYSTLTCIESHANEPWQVVAAIAAVCSTKDEKIVLIGIRALSYRELVLEEEAKSEGVDEAKRKFDQLAKDAEIARKVQKDWEAEEEMKKLAEEEATKAALIQDFDDIQARY